MQVEMVLQAVLSTQAGWDISLDSSLALSGTNIVPIACGKMDCSSRDASCHAHQLKHWAMVSNISVPGDAIWQSMAVDLLVKAGGRVGLHLLLCRACTPWRFTQCSMLARCSGQGLSCSAYVAEAVDGASFAATLPTLLSSRLYRSRQRSERSSVWHPRSRATCCGCARVTWSSTLHESFLATTSRSACIIVTAQPPDQAQSCGHAAWLAAAQQWRARHACMSLGCAATLCMSAAWLLCLRSSLRPLRGQQAACSVMMCEPRLPMQVVKMLNSIAELGPRIVSGRDAGLHASGHSYRWCSQSGHRGHAAGADASMMLPPLHGPTHTCVRAVTWTSTMNTW